MTDLSEPQMGELKQQPQPRRAALYAQLANLHAEKAAIETAIQRVQAELDGNSPDWRSMVDFKREAA